ncbi:MAG: MoaD family protein [Candidatus Methanomethyliaceae archaeon]|nr:MoaD family protein [Candidatus Methanomethyliaceae archaeon]MDW7970948.1 ubiquitin-like small modifier protein 1 [Nitrososphaerota archaeon]
MKVKIELFATLREMVGNSLLEIENVENVREAVEALIEMFGARIKEILMEGDEKKESVKILVNGKDIRDLAGLETKLRNGDCISIFPPVAGG